MKVLILGFLSVTLLAGCTPRKSVVFRNKIIEAGMKSSDLKKLLGEPKLVTPYRSGAKERTNWVYRDSGQDLNVEIEDDRIVDVKVGTSAMIESIPAPPDGPPKQRGPR